MTIKKNPFFFIRSRPPWALHTLVFDIIIQLKPYQLIQWFILTLISMTLTTYLNVSFFATITENVSQGLKYLFLLVIFDNVTSYCSLRKGLAKKTFVLDFIRQFQSKLNQRILSAPWIKIKLSDQVEIRRKIEEASSSIQYLMEEIIDESNEFAKLLTTVVTICYINPIATIFIGFVYVIFYRLYLNKKSNELLEMRVQMNDKNDKLYSKYTRTNANMFEYVIHHEKDQIINIANQLKVDIEGQWFHIDYLYAKLGLQEDILGKSCTFIVIAIHWFFHGTNLLIIPLYHYLSTLTDNIHTRLVSHIRWIRLIKDYNLIRPILEEYEGRDQNEQIDLTSSVHIEHLSFRYEGKRDTFHLQLHTPLTFQMGEVILITGKSGAGKSTFYDILNGSIPQSDYTAKIIINNDPQWNTLHSIEKCRTMVLQDSQMDYRSTIYSMITDIDEDNVEKERTPQLDAAVWKFLELVQIADFIRKDLDGNLDEEMENRLSGGQKTRLLLARALFRADQRKSPFLILDEPDKGLPAETTVAIIENIMKWYRSHGILFLTLHTERAHALDFDQVLHVEEGVIQKVK